MDLFAIPCRCQATISRHIVRTAAARVLSGLRRMAALLRQGKFSHYALSSARVGSRNASRLLLLRGSYHAPAVRAANVIVTTLLPALLRLLYMIQHALLLHIAPDGDRY